MLNDSKNSDSLIAHMRFLPKLLNCSSFKRSFPNHAFPFQTIHLSKLSYKSTKLPRKGKPSPGNHVAVDQTKFNNGCSLFNEITSILGSDTLLLDTASSGSLSSSRKTPEPSGFISSTQAVCENAEPNAGGEMLDTSVLGDAQVETLDGADVSPTVHRVAKIVRDEDCSAVSMEERLENSGVRFDSEIVEKVLKRCFKVPHLALRFFKWVKLRNDFLHTTATYNTILYLAGEAREFKLFEELLEEMEKSSCCRDIKTWTIIISRYAKTKSIGKALLTFETMRTSGHEPDVAAYKVMIHLLCSGGKIEIAMEMYKEVSDRGEGLNLSLYKMLLNCLGRSGDVSRLRLVADDMKRISQIPERDVYHCMLKSFCISGRIKEALELIREVISKGITLDGDFFEILVKGLCRAERIADALEIVGIMKMKNIVDGEVYGIIISAYLKNSDVSTALGLFNSTIESGHSFPNSTYTELMQHLFRSNEYKRGCELYDEMLARGTEPDSVVLTALLAGHVRHDQIPEAWKVFEIMDKNSIGTTRKSCSVFIKELCKLSRTDEVLKVLNRMQASKITIGDEVFNTVISYLERNGDMKNAEHVKRMTRNCRAYYRKNVVIGEAYEKQENNSSLMPARKEPKQLVGANMSEPPTKAYSDQDLEKVCGILSSPVDWFMKQEALEKCSVLFTPALVVEVLHRCSTHGQAALQFFSWVGNQHGYLHTTETYNMAIKVSGRGKDFKHMRHLFHEMRRNGDLTTSDTWTIMIMQYGRRGLTDIALRTFEEMKGRGCEPSSSTYKYLITCLCERKGRKVDEAIRTLRKMISAGHVPDKELVETYFDCLCEADQLSDARKCVDSLHRVGFSVPLSYSLYIRALCRTGKLDEALLLVDEVKTERSTLDQYTYASIVHGLLQKGRLEEALAKMDTMKQTGVYPTVHIYTSLINYYFKDGKVAEALETLKKMKEEGCEPTVVTYSALICGYMDNGKVTEAWDVFNRTKLEGPCPDYKTYSFFIDCLCKVGESEKALQLLSEMVEIGMAPSSINFRTVIYGLNREGKHELALIAGQKKSVFSRKQKFVV